MEVESLVWADVVEDLPVRFGLAMQVLQRFDDKAENALFTYIDGWYNSRRIQKELGYLSPDEYETSWHPAEWPTGNNYRSA